MNLHDLTDNPLNKYAEQQASFWAHVDTDPSRYSFGQWVEERGPWCLAANGRGERCAQASASGPLCHYHMDRAREWFRELEIRNSWRAGVGHAALSIQDAAKMVGQAQALLWAMGDDRVYFWELQGQGLVKIGHSRSLKTRLAQFRAGKGCTFPDGADPATGHLIGTAPGGEAMEKHLHRVHHAARVRGEWFRMTDALADDIANLTEQECAA